MNNQNSISTAHEEQSEPEVTNNSNMEDAPVENLELAESEQAPVEAAEASRIEPAVEQNWATDVSNEPASAPNVAMSNAAIQARQDAMAKQRARGTSQTSNRPEAIDVLNETPPNTVLPGAAEVVPSSSPTQPPVIAPNVASGMSSQESQDAMAKQRARGFSRRMHHTLSDASVGSESASSSVVLPGAVAVIPSQEPEVSALVSAQHEEQPQATSTSPMSQESLDIMAKQRGRGSSRMNNRSNSNNSTSEWPVGPGAVNVQPSGQPAESSLVPSPRGGMDDVAQVQASPHRHHQVVSQAEQDAIAKSRSRRGITHSNNSSSSMQASSMVSTPAYVGGSTTTVEGAELTTDTELRREERAEARSQRRGGRSTAVGAQSVVSTLSSTAESRKMARESQRSSSSIRTGNADSDNIRPPSLTSGESAFSNMSESERQRRYDAKMTQMEQQHEDTREKRTPGNARDNGSYQASSSGDTNTGSTSTMMTGFTMPTDGTNSGDATTYFSEAERQRYDPRTGGMSDPQGQLYDGKAGNGTNYHPAGGQVALTHLTMVQDTAIPEKSDELRSAEQVAYSSINPGKYRDDHNQPGYSGVPAVENNGLAVAIAIETDEDEILGKDYTYAVEYDPDSKPPLYHNRRFRLYGIVGGIFFVILAIVLIVIGVTSKKEKDVALLTLELTPAPTMAPTTSREILFRNYLVQEIGPQVSIADTPHFSATQWIMYVDPLQLEPQDPNFLQRYMMAFFYFHTTNNNATEWKSCNPPKEGEDDFCEFLEFSRQPDDTIAYVPRSGSVRWLSGRDECEWVGIECLDGPTILGFTIFGQELSGTLPTELAALPFLQRISVAYNMFEGPLPAEWARMTYLLDIEVHGNMLTGTIPAEYFETETLRLLNFNIGDNLFSGTLDTRIGLMQDLKGLHVFENNFVGAFPTEIGNLDYLSFSRVNGNEFDGPLPSELGRLRQLSELWYHGNLFSGPFPSELGLLYRLGDLSIWGNPITGTIPDELFNLSKLRLLRIHEMELTGTLSTLVGQLTDLLALFASKNQLTGTIPSEIQNIAPLQLAWLHWNQFTGQVPDSICALVQPNGLQFLQADCHPVDDPPNPCQCCSACCTREPPVCVLNELL